MPAKVTKAPPTEPESAAELRHYTPEEVVDPNGEFRLPTTVRQLKKLAYAREIPFNKLGGRISFTLTDIRAISELYAVKPHQKPAA